MKNNPYRVSFKRSVCGHKTPFFIGVFLVFSLILGQPLLVLAAVDLAPDATAPVDTTDQISTTPQDDSGSVVDQTTATPPTDQEAITPPIDSTVDQEVPPDTTNLSEEQIADLKALDEMLANGKITQDEYNTRKQAIIGTVNNPTLNSPLNITGINPKSQTLGKYISPDVSVVDGSLNYAYQIAVPPGRAGLSPDIKLVYDSNNTAQNSIVGIGWAFNIPYIQRINKQGVNRTYDENYFMSSLDGELIDQGNGIYIPRVENGNFLKYVYNGVSWIVTDKNGTQYNFGTNTNGRQDDPDNSSRIFTWMLNKTIDTNGNTISYTYFKDQGQIYPDTISYNQTGIFSVEFSHTPRTYSNISYGPAFKVITAYRISSINVKINGSLSNKYTISSNDDNLVQSVLVEGYQGSQSFSLPPTQFKNFTDEGSKKWDYDSSFTLPKDPTTGKVLVLDYTNSAYYGSSFMDINGDGLMDIVRWTANQPNGYSTSLSGNEIYLNTGKGFQYSPNFLLPVDSLTKKVFTLNYTNCTTSTCNPGPSSLYGSKFIDINGDGLPDIVRWDSSRGNNESDPNLLRGNQVFLNTGTGFKLETNFLLPTDSDGKVLALDYSGGDSCGSSFVDINGDGRPDIVRWDRNHTKGYSSLISGNEVFLNTGSGFILESNSSPDLNFTNTLPTDLSNGKVLTLNYTFCGTVPQYCNPNISNLYGNRFIDINGDGLVDIVRWTQGQTNGYVNPNVNTNGNQVFLNTGTSFQLDSTFHLPTNPSTDKVLALDFKYGAGSTFFNNSFMDINGDGLIDVVRWVQGQPNGYSNTNYVNGNQVFLNTGTGFKLETNFLLPMDSNQKVLALESSNDYIYGNSFKDINGDGLPDIVRWDTNHYNGYSDSISGNQIFINTGSGFVLDSGYTLPTITPNGKVLTLDYTVCKLVPCSSFPSVFYGNSLMDINGDGILDVVRWYNSQPNGAPNDLFKGNQIFSGTIGRKAIKKIISSLGGEDTFSFRGIRQFTNGDVGLNANIPSEYNPFVVDSHMVDYKNGNVGTTKYEYHGASYFNLYNKPLNKKIAGFSEVIKKTPSGAVITTKYYQDNNQIPSDSYTKIGKVYEEIVQDGNNNLFSRTRTNYSENTLGVQNNLGDTASSIQVESQLTQIYDGNSTHKDTQEKYTYDQYGNLTQKTSLGEVIGGDDGNATDIGNDKFTENISYAINPANYIVGFPSVDTVLNQLGDKIRESKIYYDNLPLGSINVGNQTKKENWKTGKLYVNTKVEYNSYGLPINSTDERGKITNYAYDTYNLYPIRIKDPLGHETNFTYDYATGKLNSKIDPNGLTYQSIYDGFGRILEERVPDLIAPYVPVLKTKYIYTDTPLSASVKTMNYLDDANTVDSYQYFDGFGNIIQERNEAEGVNNFNVKDTIYNESGLVRKESLKYLSIGNLKTDPTTDPLYISYFYDVLGRVSSTLSAIGTTSTIYDDWETTSIDANNKIKNYYKDAYGNLVKVEEKNGNNTYTTTYEWDGNKNLTKITDALGNIRNFTYDTLGRRLTAEDLHSPTDTTFGIWTYAYDDAGNLIQTTSPKGDTVMYSYDDLNRVMAEFYPTLKDPKVSYLYDSGINGIGKLYATFISGANTNYSYNSNGAITTENKIIDNVTYPTSYTYDRLGNVLTITYPDKSQVRYSYDNAGLLDKIERKEDDLFTDVVSNFDYSPMGQVTNQVNANGTITTNSYDATKLYRLVNTKTLNSSQIKLQDISYTYDSVGNITSVVDASNTDNSKNVSYTYDDLNRLLSATASNVATGRTPYAQTFSYDAVGNILSGSLGTYAYSGEGYTNPHAVTRIASPNYIENLTYDKNGNLIKKTTTGLTAILNASVNPNGLSTRAGLVGPGAPGIQPIGSGSSPVSLGPVNLSNLAPNSTYSYQISGSNTGLGHIVGGSIDGNNSIVVSTSSGPKPSIVAYSLGNIGKYSATIMAEINPNGRSTDAWYELQGVQKDFTHLPDDNDLYNMQAYTLSGLSPGKTYQVKIVAKNDKGTTETELISFTTLPQPPPPPPTGTPPIPTVYEYPYVTSVNVKMNVPTYQLDNDTYTWNYKNQLTGVSNSTSTNSYSYDYAGSRVKSSVFQKNLDKTYTTYTPTKFYEITKNSSAEDIETKYIYAGDTLVATVKKVGTDPNETSYVYHDNLGGTNVTAKSDGSLLSALDYYPYGAQRICSGDCGNDKKYIGQYYDVDTGLNYLNARYYSADIGRFISEDSMFWSPEKVLMDPQSLNSYSYARNNPIILSDPSGMFGINSAPGLIMGVGTEALNTVVGLFNMVMHPVDTGVGLYNVASTAITHPIDTYDAIKNAISSSIDEFSSSSDFDQGKMLGGGVFFIGTMFIGEGEVSGASKLSKLSELEKAENLINVGKVMEGTKATSFFEGARYGDNALRKMSNFKDPYHSFPELIKDGESMGTTKVIIGKDGIPAQKLSIPGSVNNVEGNFEFIKDSNNIINHRLFVPNQ